MLDGFLVAGAAGATILTAVVAVGQLYSSSRAEAKQRDVELTRWGHAVIELMAELETACYPISQDAAPVTTAQFEKLAERGSALADMGRLFFPNYQGDELKGPRRKPGGLRVRILDDVIRATYVASHLASSGEADRRTLRAHIWQARKSFVTSLQQEMGDALRNVGAKSAGDHVPQDPANWAPPTRDLPYAFFRREDK